MLANIQDGKTELGCPASCPPTSINKRGKLTNEDFKKILNKPDFEKWEQRQGMKAEKLDQCYTPDCEGILNKKKGFKTTFLHCQICKKAFCL
jgi:hypothetical protein